MNEEDRYLKMIYGKKKKEKKKKKKKKRKVFVCINLIDIVTLEHCVIITVSCVHFCIIQILS